MDESHRIAACHPLFRIFIIETIFLWTYCFIQSWLVKVQNLRLFAHFTTQVIFWENNKEQWHKYCGD